MLWAERASGFPRTEVSKRQVTVFGVDELARETFFAKPIGFAIELQMVRPFA